MYAVFKNSDYQSPRFNRDAIPCDGFLMEVNL